MTKYTIPYIITIKNYSKGINGEHILNDKLKGYMCKSAKPSQFLCHETGKNFFLEHISRTSFFSIIIQYIMRNNSWISRFGFVTTFFSTFSLKVIFSTPGKVLKNDPSSNASHFDRKDNTKILEKKIKLENESFNMLF